MILNSGSHLSDAVRFQRKRFTNVDIQSETPGLCVMITRIAAASLLSLPFAAGGGGGGEGEDRDGWWVLLSIVYT
jgi:hypothetical protein